MKYNQDEDESQNFFFKSILQSILVHDTCESRRNKITFPRDISQKTEVINTKSRHGLAQSHIRRSFINFATYPREFAYF